MGPKGILGDLKGFWEYLKDPMGPEVQKVSKGILEDLKGF